MKPLTKMKWTKQEANKLKKMRSKGKTLSHIAQELGRPRESIRKKCQREGIYLSEDMAERNQKVFNYSQNKIERGEELNLNMKISKLKAKGNTEILPCPYCRNTLMIKWRNSKKGKK